MNAMMNFPTMIVGLIAAAIAALTGFFTARIGCVSRYFGNDQAVGIGFSADCVKHIHPEDDIDIPQVQTTDVIYMPPLEKYFNANDWEIRHVSRSPSGNEKMLYGYSTRRRYENIAKYICTARDAVYSPREHDTLHNLLSLRGAVILSQAADR